MSDNPTCETCRWFGASHPNIAVHITRDGVGSASLGLCRRFPLASPKYSDDFCGEHAPRANGGDHPKGGHDEAEGRGESPDAPR